MPAASGRSLLDVSVNGEQRRVGADTTLLELLALLGLSGRRLAVAVNRQVIPRRELCARLLADGDRVEVLEAVGGG